MNLFAAHHLIRLCAAIPVCRVFPFIGHKAKNTRSTLGAILRADLICDITGGDSFSDIYGISRFLRGCLVKRLCQRTGKPFVLLPQTYGPFKSRLARCIARSVLKRAAAIYSRDHQSLEEIRRLMGSQRMRAVPQLCPDVAFVLEPRKPVSGLDLLDNSKLKTQNAKLIGLNISGLLYSGGYTKNNQFGLKVNHPKLLSDIIKYFLSIEDIKIILVPHVYGQVSPENVPDIPGENDLSAAYLVLKKIKANEQQRVIIITEEYDANEIKYIIGQCDFFLGARMHATIAALSQCIPAVGMAYSKKFAGVFETIGVADSVVDMRTLNEQEVLDRIQRLYKNRTATRETLKSTIPTAHKKVLSIFQTLTE